MQIYDRYNGDPAAERRRYADRLAKVRRGLRKDYNLGELLGVVLFAAAMAILAILVLMDTVRTWMGVLWIITMAAALAMQFYMKRYGDPEKEDLYIYGMEGGRFLLMNPLYEVLRRVSPEGIREIRIIPAMRPTTRQRVTPVNGVLRDTTDFEPWGEPRETEGEMQLALHPMAVLHTGDEALDWRYLHDPICRRPLQKYLSIVPMGENAMPFAYALRQSSCPVAVSREMYEGHRELLDAIFAQSGMDMQRIRLITKEEMDAGL